MTSVTSQTGAETRPMFIGGRWFEGAGGDAIAVENPADETLVATVPAGTADDAAQALAAARAAFPAWSARPAIERGRLLLKLAGAVERDAERLARLVVAEQGKPLGQARGEAAATVTLLTYAAEAARRIEGDILPSETPGEELWIRRLPYGVVVALTAWNYPLALAARKLGPALVTGNTVVVKPHELTPLSSLELARLAEEVGFPAGVINVVTGTGHAVGEALVRSDQSDLVTMTGSVRAGREIYAAGAEQIKVLRLELGGKAPFIVMEDADIGAAVDAAIVSRFLNCGQVCTCNERMYLHERIADEFLDRFIARIRAMTVGDPMTDPDLGPKISRAEVDKVAAMVGAAAAAGGEILVGGKRLDDGAFARGHWYAPTVITGLDNNAALLQQEIFGPIVPVIRVGGFDEALRLANQSRFGLSAYVFTRDVRRLMRLTEELAFGELYINRACGESVQGFHTGWRLSGIGGEDGRYGIDGYLRKKTMYLKWA